MITPLQLSALRRIAAGKSAFGTFAPASCPDTWGRDLNPFRRSAPIAYRNLVERAARTRRGPVFEGLRSTYRMLLGTRRPFIARPASEIEAAHLRHYPGPGRAVVLGTMFLSRGGTLTWGDGGSRHEGRVFGHYILSGHSGWAEHLLNAAEPELRAAFERVDGLEWMPDPVRGIIAVSSGCIEVDRRGRYTAIL